MHVEAKPASAKSSATGFSILIVDDEDATRVLCRDIASEMGLEVHTASTTNEALGLLEQSPIDIVVTDLKVPELGGLELLKRISAMQPNTSVMVLTQYGTIETAVTATRLGARDYVTKPFHVEELRAKIERLIQSVELDHENRVLREQLRTRPGFGGLIGISAKMQRLYKMIEKVSQHNYPVLILGESGTGKELAARAIHANGVCAGKPFVPVDCGSLAPTLIESELFGHVKGAFTGAHRPTDGLLVAAGSGTVFLDEIGELPLDLQAKLLRALQEKEVRPLGGSHAVPMKARILAATHQDLTAMVEQGKFRRDLYYRLNVVKITMPPLRERKEDIPLLAAHFLERNSREISRPFRLSADTLSYLVEYSWPGNVRELSNAIDRACNQSSGEMIEMAEMTTSIRDSWMQANASQRMRPAEDGGGTGVETLAQLERRAILTTLDQVKGDKLMAARLLAIGKTTLYRKLKEYGVQP
jgi:two-component system response regulator HydG